MIYLTGDVHCPYDIAKLNTRNWPEQKLLTRADYLIVCGDMGIVWDGSHTDRYWQNWFQNKPFTTLFVDGNHENHDLLDQMPIEEWKGGKIHRIRPNVYHLLRGQVFEIDGISLFSMGGASSHDKEYRQEGVSWWPRELPNHLEYCEALENLEQHGWKVDLVVTHCAPNCVQDVLKDGYFYDKLTRFFDEVLLKNLSYENWFFGHYHTDIDIDERLHGIYEKIVSL